MPAATRRHGSSALARLPLAAMLAVAFACSDGGDDNGGSPPMNTFAGAAASGVAGLSGSGAGSVSAGTGGTAPFGGTGGAAGTTPVAGSGGSAGGAAAGAGPSGGSGGVGGAGGASTLDAGAPTVDAGALAGDAGGSTTTATPSAGCSSGAGRPTGGVVAVAQSHYIAFPPSYDGTQPFPVLVGFHGCGSVNRGTSRDDTEWMRLTDASAFANEYVRVVPVSADSGGCWSYGTDIARVKQIYDDLLASYCVDTSRVFATGHSSGAQFIVQILLTSHVSDAQHFGFAGVAPVAASDYGPMTGPIPVLYIQGMMDAERGYGDGHETVDRFRDANGCAATSMPYSQVSGCQSGATTVSPGCVSYDGCQAPTLWCSHDDPAYSGTMHGVPCFGITAIHDFFESL